MDIILLKPDGNRNRNWELTHNIRISTVYSSTLEEYLQHLQDQSNFHNCYWIIQTLDWEDTAHILRNAGIKPIDIYYGNNGYSLAVDKANNLQKMETPYTLESDLLQIQLLHPPKRDKKDIFIYLCIFISILIICFITGITIGYCVYNRIIVEKVLLNITTNPNIPPYPSLYSVQCKELQNNAGSSVSYALNHLQIVCLDVPHDANSVQLFISENNENNHKNSNSENIKYCPPGDWTKYGYCVVDYEYDCVCQLKVRIATWRYKSTQFCAGFMK